ncbi:MAG: biotin--[acetyl-CoA-carboxylase] ligase [Phycisphaerales bacterium]|nr:biotin--[acetyl-CoA-carboxylase] ligase [Phycisphaerales bacterium]
MSAQPDNNAARIRTSKSAPGNDAANSDTPLELWSEALQNAMVGLTHFKSATVLSETDSTQNIAATSAFGCVVATGRQRAGRGRLGNHWTDTGHQGLAATFVVQTQSPDRLAMAAAVATATTLRFVVQHDVAARIGVKWPNDIVVARGDGAPQKLAGILIESKGDRALIGIGINILQSNFENELTNRAVSLLQLGQECDRLEVLLQLTRNLDHYLSASNRVIEEVYETLDRTAGLRMKFLTPQGVVEGVVLRCDPAIGLMVQTPTGVQNLPSATTRVQP